MDEPMENRRIFLVVLLFFCVLIAAAGCTEREGRMGEPADSGLRIVTEENPPYNYLDADGEAAGQSTDVVREILARLHEKSPIELLPWSDAYGLALGTRNVALYSAARTPERESLFSWVGPIGKQGFVFYAPAGFGGEIPGVDEIQNQYTVGVVRDDWRHQYLVKQGFERLVLYSDDIKAIQGLKAGEADLWFGSSDSITPLSRAAGLEPTALVPVYTLREIELYIAFNKDTDEDVIRRWQAALDGMKKDGTYEEITTREQLILYTQSQGVSGAGKEALALLISKGDTRLTGTADTLRLLAGTSDLISGEMDRIQPVLANLKSNDETTTFSFISTDGNWYLSSDAIPRQDAGVRPYLATLLSGTPVTGVVITDPVTGREAAVVAVPVRSGDTVIGAVEALIDLTSLSRSLTTDLSLTGTAYFSALTGDGVVALHTHSEKIGVVSPAGTDTFSEAIRTVISEEEGEVGFYEDGIYHQAAFKASKISGWRYIIAEQGTPPVPPKTRAEEELESLLELHD
ncbi:transporter substrate-binding domain-containing protein [Methanocalculus taiwanensis]|uniref:Transporter substrate-binding domain-containing protein n=1 Tax=Methanocalculus taiwanensis TaxID=106207 RepID=A0ABD4TKT5_9EURY|nr:transporter substrate-binding domain-containing protein [Methanocalculus taiwanensis]MCQ1537890.1 transporter substrate-binding domain-containing protein [Methanocalculus taiwanensis]